MVTTSSIASQSLTYTPTDDFTGTDTFTYKVNDGASDSAIQTATITVFDAVRSREKQIGTDIDGEAAGDESGSSVALSNDGQTLAVGTRFNGGNGTDAGHVRVYRWSESSWTQLGVDIDGEAVLDQSGWSVALSSDGQTLAVGATFNDGNGTNAGHVRVYKWSGSTWSQLGGDIDGEAAFDNSGTSVALSSDGQTLAVGAPYNGGNGSLAGHVRVYAWDGSAWTQRGTDIDGETAGGFSGLAVALSSDGQTLAAGATGTSAGHVRIFAWDGSAWTQWGGNIDGEAAGDYSGFSVALSSDGQTLAVGAIGNDGNGTSAGHVRVYAWDGSAWIQRGIDIDGEAAVDQSGFSVALSSDGQTLAVGANRNNDNGTSAGHVRIYAWDGSAWTQRGVDIDGKTAGEQLGHSVALSSDGQTLAVGAPYNDGNGTDAGHVRVYDLKITAPQIGGTANGVAVSGEAYQAFDDPATSEAVDPTERLTVFDPDLADTLTFSATADGDALPSWLFIDPSTGALGGTPDVSNIGALENVEVSVSDGELSSSLAPFKLEVLADTDGDGMPDSCDVACIDAGFTEDLDDDGDGVPDTTDAFPLDPTESVDTDGDGTGNNADTDDDGDGVPDVSDAFPLDPNETADTDGDGVGDNGDLCPDTPIAELGDVNEEGCGVSERDTDGDGVNDDLDVFPLDPIETKDTDGDGFGDNLEIAEGTDPFDATDQPYQPRLPLWLLLQARELKVTPP